MIFEGVKLMVVGMATVMLFLSFMILFINLVSTLTKGFAAREIAALEAEKQAMARKRKAEREKAAGQGHDTDDDIAAIAAAVAAYEAERFARVAHG